MNIQEEAILSFLRSSIKSAWALELLLLLHRDRERLWSVQELVRELRGSTALVTESQGAERYWPDSADRGRDLPLRTALAGTGCSSLLPGRTLSGKTDHRLAGDIHVAKR